MVELCQLQRNTHEIQQEARRHSAGKQMEKIDPIRIATITKKDACANLQSLETDQRLFVATWCPLNPSFLGRQNQMQQFSRIQS